MLLVQKLFGFALETILGDGDGQVGRVQEILAECFRDPSQRLHKALQRSSERTWQTVEMALAGDSLWQKVKGLLTPNDEKAFRQQIQTLLQLAPLPDHPNREQFCQAALGELRAARKAGLLSGVSIDLTVVTRRAGAFAAFADPVQRLEAEQQAVQEIAADLQQAGYRYLAWLLGQRPSKGAPLLLLAIRYFFRREVETDAELSRGLTFCQLEALGQSQEAALRGLHENLQRHGQRVEETLTALLTVGTEARDAAVAGLETALDLKAEQQRQGQVLGELYQAMARLLEQNKLQHRTVRQGDSLSIRDTQERQAVKDLLNRYRSLSAEQRQAAPALLNGLGKLELAVGEFDEAHRAFAQAAEYAQAPAAKAEAHYNAYRAALERKDFDRALAELHSATSLDPARFLPFPMNKYKPQRILGVGGFGATFLCHLHLTGAPVAIKSLIMEGLERDVRSVFQEAAALEQLHHPVIVGVRDYGFADRQETRPYIVMEYFLGTTLEDFVKQRGVLRVEDLKPVLQPVAEALQAAHAQGILHRDVKPANILVRKEGAVWQVRLIDFGLALKQEFIESAGSTARKGRTIMESSIAGTLEYAAPEQMGKLPGVRVGPPADVYGFAKTCCYALFESAEPTFQDWQKIPQGWAELLGQCLQKAPGHRPAGFGAVLEALARLGEPRPQLIPVVALAPPPPLPPAGPHSGQGWVTPQVVSNPPPLPGAAAAAEPAVTLGKRVVCGFIGAFGLFFAGFPLLFIIGEWAGNPVPLIAFLSVALLAGGGWFGARLLANFSWGKIWGTPQGVLTPPPLLGAAAGPEPAVTLGKRVACGFIGAFGLFFPNLALGMGCYIRSARTFQLFALVSVALLAGGGWFGARLLAKLSWGKIWTFGGISLGIVWILVIIATMTL